MLLELWQKSKEQVLRMSLSVIVDLEGGIRDGNDASIHFRQFLQEVDSHKLSEYAIFCIDNQHYGEVLQDIVNEIGRRLGFTVENGRYQGVRGEIGFDGIWTSEQENIIIEVKTTTAYTINLDVIANYRDQLAGQGTVRVDSPILMIIGRNDTKALEEQVRGSRHAWSMRIIGINALIKLMEVNLSTSSKEATEKIRTILKPIEYTRIDKIVDVIFSTTEDKGEIEELADFDIQEVKKDRAYSTPQVTQKEIIEMRKLSSIDRLSKKLDQTLIRKRFSLYSNNQETARAAVAVSKLYSRSEEFYWYAYHETQRQFLSESKDHAYMIFAMADLEDKSLAIPYKWLEENREKLNSTIKADKEYKHIFIFINNGTFTMRLKEGDEEDINKFII